MGNHRRVRQYMFFAIFAFSLKLFGGIVFFAGAAWSVRAWVVGDFAAQRRMADRLTKTVDAVVGNNKSTEEPRINSTHKTAEKQNTGGHRGVPRSAVAYRTPEKDAKLETEDASEPKRQTLLATLFLDRRTVTFTIILLSAFGGLMLFVFGEILAMLRNQAINSDLMNNLLADLINKQSPPRQPRLVQYPRRVSGD